MHCKIAPSSGFLLFLVFVAVSFQGCLSPREKSSNEWNSQQWHVVKTDKDEEPAWVISTRKIKGTNSLEYKIEGGITAFPQACIAAFRKDIHDLADDPKNKKYPTYTIVQESPDSLLTYVIHREPFPFKNTEMSVRYLFSLATENNVAGVEWKENWDTDITPPASKRLSRVETFRGAWFFTPTLPNYSQAANHVQFDPKKMPRWLFEPMVFKFLIKGLTLLQELTTI